MLGKMLIHGLLTAALIGSAAAVYAQAQDNGYLKPDAVVPQARTGENASAAKGGERGEGVTARLQRDGWLSAERDHKKSDHHGDRRLHDDEDDD